MLLAPTVAPYCRPFMSQGWAAAAWCSCIVGPWPDPLPSLAVCSLFILPTGDPACHVLVFPSFNCCE